MKWIETSLTCVLLATTLMGCGGKLSKDEAHQLLQKAYFDADANAYCSWKDGFAQDWGEDSGKKRYLITNEDKYFRACTGEMMPLGILRSVGCADETCSRNMYVLGQGVDLTRSTHAIQFVCGKKALGDIISVTTEGRKATVKYNVVFSRNQEQVQGLGACKIDGPLDGQAAWTAVFNHDDDGRWSLASQ